MLWPRQEFVACVLRLPAHEHQETAVIGDAAGRAQVARACHRTRWSNGRSGDQPPWDRDLALEHPHEHDVPPGVPPETPGIHLAAVRGNSNATTDRLGRSPPASAESTHNGPLLPHQFFSGPSESSSTENEEEPADRARLGRDRAPVGLPDIDIGCWRASCWRVVWSPPVLLLAHVLASGRSWVALGLDREVMATVAWAAGVGLAARIVSVIEVWHSRG